MPPLLTRLPGLLVVLCLAPTLLNAQVPSPPKSVDDRLTIELVAMEPDVRTPTAIACDDKGRVWVLENNTHFRPKNYTGPETDRLLVMEDFGSDGRARKITTWAEGFRDGMGLLILKESGTVIVATRSAVLSLSDTDGDGRADRRDSILRMETKANYPHNGLSGLARQRSGKIYLGLGENFGAPWVLTGSDGTALHGSDEGAIFRFNPDGTGLEWWALGVWNPFGLTFNKEGQLFATDNDPSGGSLCRLLHIVRGGDYGFRMRYGRTVDHPFLSWNGQIPGTLPPVCFIGEAPCGIINYERSEKGGLPSEYVGQLIGTTWSEHGLQRFVLKANGSSFSSKPAWLVRGGADFRPSGVVQAPDGSLFVSDWASGSYEVHGKGRVWRVKGAGPHEANPSAEREGNEPQVTVGFPKIPLGRWDEYIPLLLAGTFPGYPANDPFLKHRAIQAIALPHLMNQRKTLASHEDAKVRIGALLASRRSRNPEERKDLPQWLADKDGAVRRAALQWISEEGLKEFLPEVDTVLDGQPTRATFQAYLAGIQMLTSGKPDPKATVEQTASVALDPHRAPELRALALRLLPVSYAGMTVEKLRELLLEKPEAVRIEAARILATRKDEAAQAELRRIAADSNAAPALRAEALAGLAASATQPETKRILEAAEAEATPLAVEARRSAGTHLATLASAPKGNPLEGTGDPAAGRRIFYHPNGPRCYTCHTVEGRGTEVGPDLTQMGRFTPEQLLEAIREPSKEVAPAYATWHVKMKDGKEGLGINIFEDNKSAITLVAADGQQTKFQVADMVSNEVLPTSLMPPGLDAMLTTQEFRDLLAFLREERD